MDGPTYGDIPDLRMRFVDEVGFSYWFGLTGGSAYHFLRGVLDSPNGGRLAGGAQAVRMNATRVAGEFGAFWALFWGFDRAVTAARRREDPWNAIVAGGATSGFLALRRGARAVARSSLSGAAFFALFDCVSYAVRNTLFVPTPDPDGPPPLRAVAAAPIGSRPMPVAGVFLEMPPPPQNEVKEIPAADLGY
ncbi:hypothetical protein ACP70R_014361 [Stipagrostis hirtigluma subsp. patula]